MATIPEIVIAVKEAKQLQRGGLYALEIASHLDPAQMEAISEALRPYKESHGVEFMIFDSGVHLSEIRPTGVTDIEAAIERVLSRQRD